MLVTLLQAKTECSVRTYIGYSRIQYNSETVLVTLLLLVNM